MGSGSVMNETTVKVGIQSVARACRIVLAIAHAEGGLSAREVADTQLLTLPTAYNLLSTLCREGFLEKRGDRRFVLGPARLTLAESIRRDLGPSENQLRLLRLVAQRTGETTYLSAWQGDRVVILASVEGSEPLRVGQLRPGFSSHMHARASAKLMIALAPTHQQSRVLATLDFEPLTPNTITDVDRFITEIAAIQREGLAYDRQEYHRDIAGISAGIIEEGHVTSSLTIAVPAQRFAENEVALRQELLVALHTEPV